jgi:hypothetical protein
LTIHGNKIVVPKDLSRKRVFDGAPTELGKELDDRIIGLAGEILKHNGLKLDGNDVARFFLMTELTIRLQLSAVGLST